MASLITGSIEPFYTKAKGLIFPWTHTTAVFDDSGNTVEQRLVTLNDRINVLDADSKTDKVDELETSLDALTERVAALEEKASETTTVTASSSTLSLIGTGSTVNVTPANYSEFIVVVDSGDSFNDGCMVTIPSAEVASRKDPSEVVSTGTTLCHLRFGGYISSSENTAAEITFCKNYISLYNVVVGSTDRTSYSTMTVYGRN